MKKLLKSLHFHDKILLKDSNFYLDMQQIQFNIYTLSFPQQGFKSLYMNNYKDLDKFIKQKQIQNYYLINLCDEQAEYFKQFEGHNDYFKLDEYCPPDSLYSFSNSIEFWVKTLNFDPNTYFFIYSKHGKGRAAMVACCLQIRLQQYIEFLNIDALINQCCRRILKGEYQFLMTEGQIRYIKYYYKFLIKQITNSNFTYRFPTRLLLKIQTNQPVQQFILKLNTQKQEIQCQPQSNNKNIYEYEINQNITGDFIISGKLKRKFNLPLNTIDDQVFFEQEQIDWENQKMQSCFWIRLVYEF